MHEIYCGDCNKIIAYTSSNQPLPFLICPDCEAKLPLDEFGEVVALRDGY